MLAHLRPLFSLPLGPAAPYPVLHVEGRQVGPALLDEVRAVVRPQGVPLWTQVEAWRLDGARPSWLVLEQQHIDVALRTLQQHPGSRVVLWGELATLPEAWRSWLTDRTGLQALRLQPDPAAAVPEATLGRHIHWEGRTVVLAPVADVPVVLAEIEVRAAAKGLGLGLQGQGADLPLQRVTGTREALAIAGEWREATGLIVGPLDGDLAAAELAQQVPRGWRILPLGPDPRDAALDAGPPWPALDQVLVGLPPIGDPRRVRRATRGWSGWDKSGQMPLVEFVQGMKEIRTAQTMVAWAPSGRVAGRVRAVQGRVVDAELWSGVPEAQQPARSTDEAGRLSQVLEVLIQLAEEPELAVVVIKEASEAAVPREALAVDTIVLELVNWIDIHTRGGREDTDAVASPRGQMPQTTSTAVQRLWPALDGTTPLWALGAATGLQHQDRLEALRVLRDSGAIAIVGHVAPPSAQDEIIRLLLLTGLLDEASVLMEQAATGGGLSWEAQWQRSSLEAITKGPAAALGRWPVTGPAAGRPGGVAALLDWALCACRAGRPALLLAHEVAESLSHDPDAALEIPAHARSLVAWAELSLRSRQYEAAAQALELLADRAGEAPGLDVAISRLRARLVSSPQAPVHSSATS